MQKNNKFPKKFLNRSKSRPLPIFQDKKMESGARKSI
jgi:hypothetical protein